VDGNDVSNVRVAPIEPVVVTGRVIVDAAAATLPTQTIRVSVNPKNPEDFIPLPNPAPPAAVGEDLTFQTKALPMVVTVGAMLPQGWIVRAVRSDGHDVTSSGLDLRNVTAATIEIEITDRVSQLSGDITDAQGQPAADASIVLFPQDRTVPPTNNRGGTARADADGHFSFRQLLPGSYFAAVVSDVEVGQWMDPEFLETLRQDATAVTLGEAESKTLTLKMR
jgi:hypothetical protein